MALNTPNQLMMKPELINRLRPRRVRNPFLSVLSPWARFMRPKNRDSVKRQNIAAGRPSLSSLDHKRVVSVTLTSEEAGHRPVCLSSSVFLINKKFMLRRQSTVKTKGCYKSFKMFATVLRLIIKVNPYSKGRKKWGPASKIVSLLLESYGRKSVRG